MIFLGPPGTGKTHLWIAFGVQAARRGHRVAFTSAQDWVGRLAAEKRAGRLEDELERLRRVPLVIVDEVGYIPFDPDAALFSSRPDRRVWPARRRRRRSIGSAASATRSSPSSRAVPAPCVSA